MSGRQLRRLGYITSILMFMTLVSGALAMGPGSGLEHGSEWPLNSVVLIQAHTLGQMIEWSYLLLSGLAALAALASVLGFRQYAKRRHDLRMYAGVTLLFALIQAVLAAFTFTAVWSQFAAVTPLQMGFAMMSFAGSLTLALGAGRDPALEQNEDKPGIPPAFRNLTWATIVFACLVMWLGAYISRMDVRTSCSGWPLCSGGIIPGLSGDKGVVLLHRLASLALFGLTALLGHLAFWKHGADYPELKKLGIAAVLLGGLQVLSGAVFALGGAAWYWTGAPACAAFTSGLFGILIYMSVHVRQPGSSGAASRARTR